jgi:5-methylcytosine-specific restriction endonuclease McrA
MRTCVQCGKTEPSVNTPGHWKNRCRECSGKDAAKRRLAGLGPTKHMCVDCGVSISKRAERCPSCSMKEKWERESFRENLVPKLQNRPRSESRYCVGCGAEVQPRSVRCNKCSITHKWQQAEFREKISTSVRKAFTQRADLAEVRAANPYFSRGSQHPNFKGNAPRDNAAYAEWRGRILTRDGRACAECGSRDMLQAHHVKPFSTHPELGLVLDNGITLCLDCHRTRHDNYIPTPPLPRSAYARTRAAA